MLIKYFWSIQLRPQSADPYEMRMNEKIKFFGAKTTPYTISPTYRFPFPSDSLQRLHNKKAVPSLIKQFSNSAPLAQMEVWKLDYTI